MGMTRFNTLPKIAQHFIRGRERLAVPGFLLREFEYTALGCRDLLGEHRQLLIEFDVFGKYPGARLSPARHFGCNLLAPLRHLAELILQPCQGGAFGAMALL